MAEPRSRKTSSTRNLRPAMARGDGPATLDFPDEPLSPFIGEYEILEELGHGGMGVVYKARHRELGRVVALKMVLRARFARAEELLRFRLEGEAVASLQHPNIVQLYEIGTHENQPFLVLEYVEGGTLSQKLRQGRLSIGQATQLVEVLAHAVQTAHNQGIVHRDLKPGNVLLSSHGAVEEITPKITDFGLAKQMDRSSAGLTETGRVLGTPEYMAPEQAAGRPRDVGPHTDIYALGAILYELLVARPPFVATESSDTLIQILSREPIPPRRLDPGLPRDLETIALKCLEKEPAKRYPSARDLAVDLARFREGKPIHARPVGLAERAWKWARRRPGMAALIASLVLVSVLGFVGITAALIYAVEGWRQAREQRDLAEAETGKADQQRAAAQVQRDLAREAQANAETGVAFNRLARALLEWRLNNLEGSAGLLSQIDPGRRGWEWHYLRGLHHGELRTLTRPGQARASGLSFRPDGERLAVAGGNPYGQRIGGMRSEVTIWDVTTGSLLRSQNGINVALAQVAYSTDGKFIAGSADEVTVSIWDAESGELRRSFGGTGGTITDLAWSRDCRQLFISCAREGIKGWDIASGKPVAWLKHTTHVGECVTTSPNGRFLVGSANGTRLWDAESGSARWHVPGGVYRMAFRPDSRVLACATGALIRLRSVEDGRELRSLAGHEGSVLGVAYSPCGQFLVSGGSDCTVRVWDAEEGHELSVWRGHEGRVESVAFHPGGAMVASGGSQPGDVKLWDLTRTQQHNRVFEPASHKWVTALAFSPGGDQLLALRTGGLVESRDVRSGLVRMSRELPLTSVWRTPGTLGVFSGDTSLLAALVATNDSRVRVWETRTGKRLPGSYQHTLPVWHIATTEDGGLVASAAVGVRGGDLISETAVWESATGGVVLDLSETHTATRCLTLSPDGRTLARGQSHAGATLSPEGVTRLSYTQSCIELWDIPAGASPRLCLPAGKAALRGVVFSRGGDRLATCDESGQVYLWEMPSGRRLHVGALRGPNGLEGLAFSPDGRLLAGANRNEVTVWDAREGLEVLRLRGAPPRPGDGGYSPRVTWSHDGLRLAASNWDHSVTVWDASDLVAPSAKEEQRRAARDRLPRWHLQTARAALENGRAEVGRFHLELVERLGELEPGWLRIRGHLFGSSGEWAKALRDYRAAVPDTCDLPAAEVRRLLTLMAWKGDRVEYTRLAARLLESGALTNGIQAASDTALACLLFPGAIARPERLVIPLEDLSPERQYPWLQFALSLARFRAGQSDGAIEAAQRALGLNSQLDWGCRTGCHFVLALSHRRSGRGEEAARYLGLARAALADTREKIAAANQVIPPHVPWCDWLFIQILEREVTEEFGRLP